MFSVAVLNREFLQLPVQAIECSLVNLSPSDKKNKKLVHKFLDLVNGKELVCRLDERDSEGKYMVLVIDTGHGGTVNINEEMAEHIAKLDKRESDQGIWLFIKTFMPYLIAHRYIIILRYYYSETWLASPFWGLVHVI